MERTATSWAFPLPAMRWRIGPAGIAIGLFAATLLVSVATIAHESLWFDEAVTVRVGRMGTDRFVELVQTREPFWALYYALIRPWMVLGDSAAHLRLPSAIAAATTVSLTYLVGRRLVGHAAALAGGLVLVIHAYLLHYAQEARGYTLAVALLVAATLALAIALEKPRWPAWLLYAVLGIAAVYAHFYAAFVIAGHGIVLLVRAVREGGLRSWLPMAALGAIVVGTLPLAMFLVNEPPREFADRLTFDRLVTGLAWMSGVVSWQQSPVLGAMVAVMLAAVVIGAARLVPDAISRDHGWRAQVVILWLALPLTISLAISLLVKPAFTDKYLVLSLPAVALAVGVAVTRIRPLPARIGAAAIVAAILATSSWSVLFDIRKPDWNAAAALALRNALPGDVVVSQPVWQWTPLQYALDECTPGRVPEPRPIGSIDDAGKILDELREEDRRIWLVVFDYRVVPLHESVPFLDQIERGHRLVLDEVVHLVRVMLYEPERAAVGRTPLAHAPPSTIGAEAGSSSRPSDWFQASHCSTTRQLEAP